MSKDIHVAASSIEHFRRDGYFLQRGFISQASALEAANWLAGQNQEGLAKSWTEQEPGVPLAVLTAAHVGDHPIARLAMDGRIAGIAGALMGMPVYMSATKVNVKAAWCGAVEYYHQDLAYWMGRGYPRPDLLTCMVFLQPHTVRNAALHVFLGTHRLGIIEHTPFININGLGKYMVPPRMLDRLYREHGLVAIEGEPGDAVFFHAGVVHGSAHNIAEQPRTVLIVQLNAVGNEPIDPISSAREANLRRAERELREAQRRYDWFKQKYEQQQASAEITFTAPIPERERGR
jgi:ectoine hydroxylase-related dioxygenase (phytanoyl-CoA dioxygenase family)